MLLLFLSLLALRASSLSLDTLKSDAEKLQPWLIETRREFHRYPEVMYEEFNTSLRIRNILDSLKIPYKYPFAKTGIVGTIGKGEPVVALRADMDALPVHELVEVEFKSKTPGKMHACGHDSHVTMLLGAARVLKQHEGELKGTVKLVFQPAEEGGAGGEAMMSEGALGGVGAAFGLHVWPTLPSGVVATKGGTIMAGAKQFRVTIHGQGGHAAFPHLDIDPIVAAAAIVGGVQTLVAREISPLGAGVISVTRFHSGEAYNIIPDTAEFGGTIRALTEKDMDFLAHRFKELVELQARAHRCRAEIDFMEKIQPYYPPTVNDPSQSAFVASVAERAFGKDKVTQAETSMGGEDFSFIARKIPSSYSFLGIRNESLGSTHALHSPHFTLDEGVLHKGAALHAAVAAEWLAANGGGDSGDKEL